MHTVSVELTLGKVHLRVRVLPSATLSYASYRQRGAMIDPVGLSA
jgi:hypothetical protein